MMVLNMLLFYKILNKLQINYNPLFPILNFSGNFWFNNNKKLILLRLLVVVCLVVLGVGSVLFVVALLFAVSQCFLFGFARL